jgi:sugar-specific transcriptional regulator TrmB
MGLSANEAKVYLALLKANDSPVSSIAQLSGVPQKMIYYTLQKLMHRGLCTLLPGKAKRYRPTDPSVAIGGMIEQAQRQMTSSRKMLADLEKQYDRGRKESVLSEQIEVIQNTPRIAEKMLFLESAASEEVLSFNKPPYALTKRNIAELEGLERGVIYRSIYEISEARQLVYRSAIEMYHDAGEQVRLVEALPTKMMIFDGRTLLFAQQDHLAATADLTAVVLRDSSLIKALMELFAIYWAKGMTLAEFKTKYGWSLEEKQQKA